EQFYALDALNHKIGLTNLGYHIAKFPLDKILSKANLAVIYQ
ncbi:unnamed protein product, partial [Rotaria sordida]